MGLGVKVVGAYLSVWYADQPSECPLPVIVGLAERCEYRTVGRTAQLQTQPLVISINRWSYLSVGLCVLWEQSLKA